MASAGGVALSATSLVAAIWPFSGFLTTTDLPVQSQVLVSTAIGLVFAATGGFVVWRTGNRVGWVLLGIGLCLSNIWIALVLDARQVEGVELGVLGRLVAVWIGFAWVPVLFLLAVILPLLFPTGRPPTPVWRWVAVVAGVGMVGGLIGASVETLTLPWEQVLGDESATWWIVNPTLAVGIVGAVASVVARIRHATVVERQQIKWVALALGIVAGLVLLSFTPVGRYVLGDRPVAQNLFLLTFSIIPLSIVAAVLRYRLFEIDRLMSRTVTYLLVVGVLGLAYAGLVVGLRELFPVEGDLPVAVSTLVVALAFLPLVRRVQRVVDRRFFRSRYDASVVVARVAEELRGSLDLEEVTARAESMVSEVFSPESVTVWLAGDTGTGA